MEKKTTENEKCKREKEFTAEIMRREEVKMGQRYQTEGAKITRDDTDARRKCYRRKRHAKNTDRICLPTKQNSEIWGSPKQLAIPY